MCKRFLFFLLCLSLLVFLGCATTLDKSSMTKDGTLLEPGVMLKFTDIPVPAGFRQLTNGSYSFESGVTRVGLLKYLGKANPDQLVNFYKEQMMMYNWNLINIVEYGERMLNFDKENETCIVTLSVKGKYITVSISLGPKSQNIIRKNRDRQIVK
ncbi:MAG: hypothetical protein ABIG46_08935 [Candidatus Omnitrophota bacterium]